MKVVIYTTPTCAYCKAAKAYFKENNIRYLEKDVETDKRARDEMAGLSGQVGTPVIVVTTKESKEVFIGFNSAVGAKILELLKK